MSAPPVTRAQSIRRRDVRIEPNQHDDVVTWLIDNECAYEAIRTSIRSARHSIWIAQLALDADCMIHRSHGDATLLGCILEAAAERDVSVRLLLNASLLLDTTKPLLRSFRRSAALSPRVEIRGLSAFPQLLHAKMVIVDGAEAFLMGSPFVNDYWDKDSHLPSDPSRPTRELGGRPLHDVSIRISGPSVSDVSEIFTKMWEWPTRKSGEADTPRNAAAQRARLHTDAGVQIVSTFPKSQSRVQADYTTGILDSMVHVLRSAESVIYVEHQYLSSRRIVGELAELLERKRHLKLILVLNQNPDITAYQSWQNARLTESGLLNHSRVGVFALWSAARMKPKGVSLNQIFVHSKVVTIDDRVAVVGSANLDGVSLHSYGDDFSGRIARRIFRDVRNFEVAAIVRDSADQIGNGKVTDLRLRLWAEHLGIHHEDARSIGLDNALDAWRDASRFNVAALRGADDSRSDMQSMKGYVLPYSTEVVPERQLLDLNIKTAEGGVKLEFNPGWLEVRFSPNWIRNMFL